MARHHGVSFLVTSASIHRIWLALVALVVVVPVCFGVSMAIMFVLANWLTWAVNEVTVLLALAGPTIAGVALLVRICASRLRLRVLVAAAALTVGAWVSVFWLGQWNERIQAVRQSSLVGAPRFELGASWSQTTRANQTALRPERKRCSFIVRSTGRRVKTHVST